MSEIKIIYMINKSDMTKYYFSRLLKSYKFYVYQLVCILISFIIALKSFHNYSSVDWQGHIFVTLLFLFIPFSVVRFTILKALKNLSKAGEIELVFREGGILMNMNHGHTFLKWSGFNSFEKKKNVLLINGKISFFLLLNSYPKDITNSIIKHLKCAPVRNNFDKC